MVLADSLVPEGACKETVPVAMLDGTVNSAIFSCGFPFDDDHNCAWTFATSAADSDPDATHLTLMLSRL